MATTIVCNRRDEPGKPGTQRLRLRKWMTDLSTIDHVGRWGLFPDRGHGEPLRWRAVLRHWFVRFNPLYFVSALCVLGGVFLVSRNLDGMDPAAPARPQILLFAVVQAYEALIIGGALFLVRRVGVVRPAVLLVLLEAVFLFDCTLRLESILLREPLRVAVTFAWLVLTVAKVWGLAMAMRVRLARRHYAAVLGAAAALAAMVHLLSHPSTSKLLILQVAAWLGAFVWLALDVTHTPPVSPLATTEEHRVRAARCGRGAFRIATGAYFFHVWSYIALATDSEVAWAAVLPQAGTLFLRAALVRRRDVEIWGAGVLLVCAALPAAIAVPYAFLLVSAVFAYRVWRGARSGLATGAAVAAYSGIVLMGWTSWSQPLPALPAFASWLTLALGLALASIGWRLRDRTAQALVAVGVVYGGGGFALRHLPRTEMGRGLLLLAAGFVVFLLGLAVNWWLRADDAERTGTNAAPVDPSPT
jgi:hypothetical protein